jgi:3',5'-cyclic AMP phosphodiesterase CpdA
MRILHTADWHLGRIFHGEHLTAHQAHVLDQFVAMARETRPDVIVIAGDVYDRAVPPPDALERLRRAYPHLLQIEHAAARGGAAPESLSRTAAKGGEGRDLAALFAAFHEAMTGAPLAAAARAELDAVLDALRRARREE